MAKRSKIDTYINLMYHKNKTLIDSTTPPTRNAFADFETQIKQRLNSGESLGKATKAVVHYRLYHDNKAMAEAKWHHDQFIEGLSSREVRKINRKGVSLAFSKMQFVNSYAPGNEPKEVINGITYRITQTYSSSGVWIHKAYSGNDSKTGKRVTIIEDPINGLSVI